MDGNRARALVTAVLVAVALGGCSETRGTGGMDCAWELHYGGKVYLQDSNSAKVVPHHGSPLGQGWFDSCEEGRGPDTREPVDVYRVTGVDPAQAVITANDIIGVADPAHLPAGLTQPDSP